jgi:hypothetical protein
MSSIGRRAFARILLLAAGLVFTAACANDLPTNAKPAETAGPSLSFSPTAFYVIRNVATNKVMDVENAGCCNGYFIHQWTYQGQANQQWRVEDLGNGYYRLVARHSGRVADVRNASTADGARLHQWGWDGSTNQQFSITFNGSSYYIQARHSGKALTVSCGTTYPCSITQDGLGIRQYTLNGGNTQRWLIEQI